MTDQPPPDLDARWRKLAKPQSSWRLLKPGWHWMGIDARGFADRIHRLQSSAYAKRIEAELADAGLETVRALSEIAEINANRAAAGFRITLIVNLSAPAAVFISLSQLYPQGMRNLLAVFAEQGTLPFLIAGIAIGIIGTAGFAFLRAREAQELRDLLSLTLIRRSQR